MADILFNIHTGTIMESVSDFFLSFAVQQFWEKKSNIVLINTNTYI